MQQLLQRLLLVSFLVFAIVSCRKELPVSHYPQLQQSLQDNLSAMDYKSLDFSRIARSVVNKRTLIRIAFNGKSMAESFVLAEVDALGNIRQGRIIHLTNLGNPDNFNGILVIKNLKGEIIEETTIVNGYRQRNKIMTLSPVIELDPYVVLPEVVVVSTRTASGGISWSSWYNLVCFFEAADQSGSWTGSYWNADPYSGGGGSGSGSTGSTGTSTSDPGIPGGMVDQDILEIDFESQYDDPAIDMEKYLKCFSNIPDAGATCRITIYADVPVDSDPTQIMNWESGSPGHTWLRLEKVNGSQSASQHIGFYPKTRWKTTLTDVPLEGKWVDNSLHEYNASYELNVSPAALQLAITHILYLARFIQYDIDDYNCTDWAMDVWRKAVSPTLWFDIPRFQMPGSLSPNGTATPQGLFEKLKGLQQGGTPGVEVPVIGFAGPSSGPCE